MLSFVTPVAYDWRFAIHAIRAYYPVADEIVLGLDESRISWSHKPYDFDDDAFREAIDAVDPEGKVRVIEDNFHKYPHPMANDTHEHNVLGMACREGNWLCHVDSDECLLDPHGFAAYMAGADPSHDVALHNVNVFRRVGSHYLVMDHPGNFGPMATMRRGQHTMSRHTRRDEMHSPAGQILHFTWLRSEAEMRQKLENWSHSGDADWPKMLAKWRNVTPENFQSADYQNFWPLHGPSWPRLTIKSASELFAQSPAVSEMADETDRLPTSQA